MASRFLPPAPPPVTAAEAKFLDVLKTIQKLARIADHDIKQITESILREHRQECIEVLRRAGYPCPDISDGL